MTSPYVLTVAERAEFARLEAAWATGDQAVIGAAIAATPPAIRAVFRRALHTGLGESWEWERAYRTYEGMVASGTRDPEALYAWVVRHTPPDEPVPGPTWVQNFVRQAAEEIAQVFDARAAVATDPTVAASLRGRAAHLRADPRAAVAHEVLATPEAFRNVRASLTEMLELARMLGSEDALA